MHTQLRFRTSLSIGICAVVFLLSRAAHASTLTWKGTVDTNWSTTTSPSNWDTGIPPIVGDSIVFDDSGAGLTNTDDIVGLSVAGLALNGTTNSYVLNGTTPLMLTGGATALVDSSSVGQTISLPLSYSIATTITGGAGGAAVLAINGGLNNAATTGSVNLSLSGTGTITDSSITTAGAGTNFNVPNSADNWTILDNATSTSITLAIGSIATTSGTLNFGTTTSAPNFTITATAGAGDHTIGQDSAAATLNVVNGLLLLKTRINTKNGNINVSGGQLQVWNQFQMANSSVAESSILSVSGGLLDVRNSSGSATTGGTLFVASRGSGTLNANGGTIQTGTLDVSRGAGPAVSGVASQGVVNLNAGGLIVANTVTTASANTSGTGAGSTARFNFNGGTLKARATNSSFIRDSTVAGTSIPLSLMVQGGGAIIDSNSFNINTAESFQHDPSVIGLDGGLTKKSAGTLTLTGNSNFNGPVTIQGGTLTLNSTITNNNLGAAAKYIVGDSQADSAAILNVAGITPAGGFQLQNGQTLAGFGTVNGAVSALVGSTVGPGNSIGTLKENTSLALAGTLSIDLNDADANVNDVLNDLGNLDISAATSAVTFNVTGTPSGTAYVFAKYGTLTGTAFGTVNNLPSGYSIDYNYQGNNDIALVQVPEPATWVLIACGGLGLICHRKRTSPSSLD